MPLTLQDKDMTFNQTGPQIRLYQDTSRDYGLFLINRGKKPRLFSFTVKMLYGGNG
jgi:hypothetical protein